MQQKQIAGALIVLIGLVTLGGGVYYFLDQHAPSDAAPALTQNTPIPTEQASGTPTQLPKTPPITQVPAKPEQLPDFYCIDLAEDLRPGSQNLAEVKQLQHFLNNYFEIRDTDLTEDGVFGKATAEKVIKLKRWLRFSQVKDKSSVVDSETRKIIVELTCERDTSLMAEIEFDVSGFANGTLGDRIILRSVSKVTTDSNGDTTLPGSYGSYNLELNEAIQTKNLTIDFSKAGIFDGCGKVVVGMARLSNIRQKFVNDFPAGKALTMSADLDSLNYVRVKQKECGD